MPKYEYKIEFDTKAENMPEILRCITDTIKSDLVPYVENIMPTVTVLDENN